MLRTVMYIVVSFIVKQNLLFKLLICLKFVSHVLYIQFIYLSNILKIKQSLCNSYFQMNLFPCVNSSIPRIQLDFIASQFDITTIVVILFLYTGLFVQRIYGTKPLLFIIPTKLNLSVDSLEN